MKKIVLLVLTLIMFLSTISFGGCIIAQNNTTVSGIEKQYNLRKDYFDTYKEIFFSSSTNYVFLDKKQLSDAEYLRYSTLYKINFEELVIVEDISNSTCSYLFFKGDKEEFQKSVKEKFRYYAYINGFYVFDFAWVYEFLFGLPKGNGELYALHNNEVLFGFQDEMKDKAVTLPKGVKIAAGLLNIDKGEISKLVCNAELIRIGTWAFRGLTSLTEVVLNQGLKEIGEKAFNGCVNLRKIVIPKSVEVIYSEAFTSTAVYCEVESKPDGWEDDFAVENAKVYYANEWHYDDAGNPVPNS